MRGLEAIFLWSGVVLYLFSFLFYLAGAVFKSERRTSFAWKSCVAAFVLHGLTIAARWIESGHMPVLWKFEHALAGGWFVTAAFIILGWRVERSRGIGIVITPLVALMIGYGIMSKELGIQPLPPSYQSYWLWVHVGFAWIAYGAYHIAAAVAALYLIKAKAIRKKGSEISAFLKRLPDIDVMDDLALNLIIYGFIAHIIMLGSGAIWAYGLWGRYWAWDPLEIWTLISWLIYGFNIHMRVVYGWKGRRAAWLAIISLSGVLIFFGGIGFVAGVHTTLF